MLTRVDVTAQSGTTLNLMSGSTLTGRILDDGTGGGDVTVTGPSVWRLTGDSAVGALTLNAGTVNFHGGLTTRLTPVAQAVTLTARTLSGTGTFLMNTDIAAWSGDLLNVTGNASGHFNLGIKNTGQEPVSPGEPLRVVHSGGGLYADGVVKFNHFSNTLQTQMSDGTPVYGDYSQNGYGVSLEVGKTFRVNETVWAEPYVRGTAFSADGKDIRLDNGMNLDVGGTVVKPYLTAAVSHEFADNNKVRINDRYDFRNDLSRTTGKYGLGVSAQLTPNAGVWVEAGYENDRQTGSPVTSSVWFRINF